MLVIETITLHKTIRVILLFNLKKKLFSIIEENLYKGFKILNIKFDLNKIRRNKMSIFQLITANVSQLKRNVYEKVKNCFQAEMSSLHARFNSFVTFIVA